MYSHVLCRSISLHLYLEILFGAGSAADREPSSSVRAHNDIISSIPLNSAILSAIDCTASKLRIAIKDGAIRVTRSRVEHSLHYSFISVLSSSFSKTYLGNETS